MTPRDKITDLKSFEAFLRARGFSRREALVICTAGFKAVHSEQAQQGFEGRPGDRSKHVVVPAGVT